jgi:Tfp pilus assembly protein PilO
MNAKQEMNALVAEFTTKVSDLARRITLEALDLAFANEVSTEVLEKTAAKQGQKLAKKMRKAAKKTVKRARKALKKKTARTAPRAVKGKAA